MHMNRIFAHIYDNSCTDHANIKLLRHNNSLVSFDSILRDNKYVMLYFAAHWAPSCQRLTPFLADFYNEYHNVLSFEIIFVSLDRTEKHMLEFYNGIKSNYVRRGRAAQRHSCTSTANANHSLANDKKNIMQDNNVSFVSTTAISKPNGYDSNLLIPYADTHGDWLALPFDQREVLSQWKREYKVIGIPQLVILESKTCALMNCNAMNDIMDVMRLRLQSKMTDYLSIYETSKLAAFPWPNSIPKTVSQKQLNVKLKFVILISIFIVIYGV